MGFIQSVSVCLRKYFTFSGRASRSEFWWFYLLLFGIFLLRSFMPVVLLHMILNESLSAETFKSLVIPMEVLNLIPLILVIPIWAAASRRLHDIGKSGWWQLVWVTGIGIFLLVVWLAKGTEQEDNKYGPLEQS